MPTAPVLGQGTTFNLPNYVGELFAVTPSSTPLLSAIGGLTGGKGVAATEWDWQTYDLRDPSNKRTRLEGANAPTSEERVRAAVRNVVEIHQETVSVSYTKQAANQQLSTPSAAPYQSNGAQSNPVMNEMNWQVLQAIKSIALDVNYTFINGKFAQPTTNATPRQTRGLLQAITTNRIAAVNTGGTASTEVTGVTTATDTVTFAAHGLTVGKKIVFTEVSTATGIVAGRVYWVVVQPDANTFKVGTAAGGTPITLGTATGLSYRTTITTALTTDMVTDLLQLAYDNGGLSEESTATLLLNSVQKRAVTKAYMSAFGQFHETSRNVGGVDVDTIETDFGTLSVMLDRHMPQDTIAVVSLEQLMPVFLQVPGKGHFFEEELAKVGAADNVQIYGEIGLEYGNERTHGVLTGLLV